VPNVSGIGVVGEIRELQPNFAPKLNRITNVEPIFVSPYNANTLLSAALLSVGRGALAW